MLITRVDKCPACFANSAPIKVASMSQAVREKYLDFSKRKYNGLIDDWLNQLQLEIDHCAECGHNWYYEQPGQEMLSLMYSTGRPLHVTSASAEPDRAASSIMIAEMARLKKLVKKPNATLLDYGSGFGRWARAGIIAGFEVTAFEPSETRGVEEKNLGFNLVHDTNSLTTQKFDVINLEQVLEHVSDPVATLKEIRQYCADGAVVRITVPNVLRCPEGKQLWRDWPFNGTSPHTMAPFEHLHGFTPRSLMSVAEQAGFKSVTGLSIWSIYFKEKCRAVIGRFLPKLGQTWMIVRIK